MTLLLQAFKNAGGLDAVKDLLEFFFHEVESLMNASPSQLEKKDDLLRSYSAMRIILRFFYNITNPNCIKDTAQTTALASSSSNDKGSIYYFHAGQFLVELRAAVLPVVKLVWDSDLLDKAESSIVKSLVDILKTTLEGKEENGAHKRGSKIPARTKPPHKGFTGQRERMSHLLDQGHDPELAREALYRCNSQTAADEYCKAATRHGSRTQWYPMPSYDMEKVRSPSSPSTPNGQEVPLLESDQSRPPSRVDPDSTNTTDEAQASDRMDHSHDQIESEAESASTSMPPPPAPGVPDGVNNTVNNDGMDMSIENLLNVSQGLVSGFAAMPPPGGQSRSSQPTPSSASASAVEESNPSKIVTVDDLDDIRTDIRQKLLDRTLDVLNVHDDLTFELSELISATTSKTTDGLTVRREIGETLLQSLISFQMDDDFRASGKKIAAYAHLLALVIQDRDFYKATLDELKSNFASLLSFIKIFPDQSSDEPSPWISQILLVVEKMLSEDVQPSHVQFKPPITSDSRSASPIASLEKPQIPFDEKIQLFEAVVDILPRIGKDESLALSVVRVLVILTRDHKIASKLGERRNIQRLFVMAKQLAGFTSDRLQSSFMLLLRHMVEDEETIKHIIRSEILSSFDTRPGRNTDTTGYIRQMYHLVLRSPETFVNVTNETLEIQDYDGNPESPQILGMKAESQESDQTHEDIPNTEARPSDNVTVEAPGLQENKSGSPNELVGNVSTKAKSPEVKPPVVEHPSGVIHYLLSELLSYKDVDDKEPSPPSKKAPEEANMNLTTPAESSDSTTVQESSAIAAPEGNGSSKPEKVEFKAEQHPIHVYRCFILQCLTELVHSYNRAKIEFINFSRKADPKAMTPSKPRSGVLNHLLTEVIPLGTLSHDDSISYRKKSTTSNWAMSVIVGLVLKTTENGPDKKAGSLEEKEEPDLLFVRKFVLEHALKAYKDANSAEDTPDTKYARLLGIADLFNRMLGGKLVQGGLNNPNEISIGSQKPLARTMFEKSFITAFTSSIADIDLNFPGSKRAVKYILRPLKQLTQTAIVLSERSDFSSTPGQTDDDEISSATSVSEMDDEREETPDLFRNSTLGMFEPGREEETSSDSSEDDEDMYDDGYDEEGGFEDFDPMERDEDDVISDEDEEIGDAGHMEGLPGDTGMDVEVVIDGEEGPSDDDDEDPDDSEEVDEGEELEIMDEITGDDENNSLVEGDDEDWQDEDEMTGPYDMEEDGSDQDASQDRDPDQEDPLVVHNLAQTLAGVEDELQHIEDEGPGLTMAHTDNDFGEVMARDEDDEDDEGKNDCAILKQ